MISLPGNSHQIAMALANTISLTNEEKQILSTELQKQKYAGKTNKQILAMLHDPTADFVEQRIDANWHATRKFLSAYQYGILTGRPDLSAQIKQKWFVKIPAILAAYTDDYKYNARTSAVFAAIADDAIADGVCTEDEVEDFKTLFESEKALSTVEKLFGFEKVLELSDLEAL